MARRPALPVPHGADAAAAVTVAGDWAAGDASLPPTGSEDDLTTQAAVRWNLRTGAVELISGISGSRVSAAGTFAGTTSTGALALWRDGRIFTLPLPAGGSPYRNSLSGISADGHTLVGAVEMSSVVSSTSGPASDPAVSDQTVPVVWRGC